MIGTIYTTPQDALFGEDENNGNHVMAEFTQTWKNLETWNFAMVTLRPGKGLEF